LNTALRLLREKEILHLTELQGPYNFRLHRGVLRVRGDFGSHAEDVTLALCTKGENQCIQPIRGASLSLEALVDSSFSQEQTYQETSVIHDWLIDMHLLRQLVGAEARIIALLQLLVERFGYRHKDNYSLPFWISHSRMAEIAATSRVTVTRQITLLRKNQDLIVDEEHGGFFISRRLMNINAMIIDRHFGN
jgi:hypothetical protein